MTDLIVVFVELRGSSSVGGHQRDGRVPVHVDWRVPVQFMWYLRLTMDHKFTCHPHVHSEVEWAMPAFFTVSCRTSPPFGRYLFPIQLKAGCWVGLGGWLRTTLPQFVGPRRRRVWSTSTPLCRIEPFAHSAVQIVNHRRSSVSGRSSTVLEQASPTMSRQPIRCQLSGSNWNTHCSSSHSQTLSCDSS